MNFTPTDKQESFRQKVRAFSLDYLVPRAYELDKTYNMDLSILGEMAKLNLFGICIPEKYRGAGLDNICAAIAIEEIARVCASTAVILSVHTCLNENIVMNFGSDYLKDKYLPLMAGGEKISAFALTEAQAGSDIYSMSTQADFDGKNYILNGSKVFITGAGFSDLFLVFAYTNKEKNKDGMSVFLVEKGIEGFILDKKEKFLGVRATSNCIVNFDNCRIPKENLIGQDGEGFKIALKVLNGGRIGIAAQALGIAQGALDEAVKFAKSVNSPNQLIQSAIAEMSVLVDAARLLIYKAAYMKDQGKNIIKEASQAKYFASEAAVKVTSMAVSLCGIYGVDEENPVQRHYRNAKITQIYEGTSELQKLNIAKRLLSE